MLTTGDFGCLCATFSGAVPQHGELEIELYSVGDIEPVEYVVQ